LIGGIVGLFVCSALMFGASRQAYRVGDGVSVPAVLYRVDPEYTLVASNLKIQGQVILQTEVTKEGIAENIEVVKSLDSGLDEQAIKAVGKWRFKPAMKDGKPVRVLVTVEVLFKLPPQTSK
jgi:protein TonB